MSLKSFQYVIRKWKKKKTRHYYIFKTELKTPKIGKDIENGIMIRILRGQRTACVVKIVQIIYYYILHYISLAYDILSIFGSLECQSISLLFGVMMVQL